MKKSLSIALSLLMIIATLTAIPFSASAATVTGMTGRNTSFTFDTETGEMVVSGNGYVEQTGFDEATFGTACNYGIKKLTVKDGVSMINTQCFSSLTLLKSIVLENVHTIAVASFDYCTALEDVDLGKVKTIGEEAFLNCNNLTEVTVPDSVESIGDYAFGYYKDYSSGTPELKVNDSFYMYAKCSNAAAKSYHSSNPEVGYSEKHDFNNPGTITAKAGLNYQWGTILHKCNYGCTTTEPEMIEPIKKVVVSPVSYVYNGKARTPGVTVYNRVDDKLKKGTDYSVVYSNTKNVGTGEVKITFKGRYTGKKIVKITINPKGTQIKSAVGQKKARILLKWNKQTTQTTGYKIEVSTTKKFTDKTTKKYTIKNNKTASAYLSGFKGGKTYYIRMRTYKTVNGKTYYSSYSKVATAKTKK